MYLLPYQERPIDVSPPSSDQGIPRQDVLWQKARRALTIAVQPNSTPPEQTLEVTPLEASLTPLTTSAQPMPALVSSHRDHSLAFLPSSVGLENSTLPLPALLISGALSVPSPTDQSSLGSLSQLSKPCQCELESTLASSIDVALLTPSELLLKSREAIPNLPVPHEVLNVPFFPTQRHPNSNSESR